MLWVRRITVHVRVISIESDVRHVTVSRIIGNPEIRSIADIIELPIVGIAIAYWEKNHFFARQKNHL